jgi:hypothetical protein
VIKLENNNSSIRIDESKDFTNEDYIVTFARFVNDGEIQENFCSYKKLPATNRVQDIFNALSSYLETKVCLGRTVQASVVMMPHQWLAPLEVLPLMQKKKIRRCHNTMLYPQGGAGDEMKKKFG